jgi:hypothetical protein
MHTENSINACGLQSPVSIAAKPYRLSQSGKTRARIAPRPFLVLLKAMGLEAAI